MSAWTLVPGVLCAHADGDALACCHGAGRAASSLKPQAAPWWSLIVTISTGDCVTLEHCPPAQFLLGFLQLIPTHVTVKGLFWASVLTIVKVSLPNYGVQRSDCENVVSN